MHNGSISKQKRTVTAPASGKVLDFYLGIFESVYVLLYPFLRPKNVEANNWPPSGWPSGMKVVKECEAVSWAQMLALTKLHSLSDLEVGFLTAISSLRQEFEDKALAKVVTGVYEKENLLYPEQGHLSPLIELRLLEALRSLGSKSLWVGDEFGDTREEYSIDELMALDKVPWRGVLFTGDHSLLVSTHWSNHYSFLCSDRSTIEQILKVDEFEGFFCNERTDSECSLREI